MKGYMVLMLVCLASLQIIVDGRGGGARGGGLSSFDVSQDGSFSVKFLNDALNNDVYIRSHESQVADLLPNFPSKDWGCGTKNENQRCTRLRNGELLWSGKYTYTLKGRLEDLEAKITYLEDALANSQTLEDLEAKLTDLEDALVNTQTKVIELENCLADISSPDCPLPPIGKTSVAGGISGNAAALVDKCDASTCSDIQEEMAKLKPKLSLEAHECLSDDGSFFGPEGGRIKAFSRINVGEEIDITMSIKPQNLTGMLVGVRGPKDYLILELVNGEVVFRVENGKGVITASLKPEIPLDDGNFHEIKAVKVGHVVLIKVDNEFATPGAGAGEIKSTDTNDPLFIGGHARPNKISNYPGNFEGCIKDVFINKKMDNSVNNKLDITRDMVYGDVTI